MQNVKRVKVIYSLYKLLLFFPENIKQKIILNVNYFNENSKLNQIKKKIFTFEKISN